MTLFDLFWPLEARKVSQRLPTGPNCTTIDWAFVNEGSTGRHLWWPFLTVSGPWRPEKGCRRTRLIVLRITWLLPFFSPGKVFLVVGRFVLIVGSFSMLWEQQRLNKIKGIKPEEVGWKEASSTSWRIRKTWHMNFKSVQSNCWTVHPRYWNLCLHWRRCGAPSHYMEWQYILEAAYTRLSSCALTTLSSLDTVKNVGDGAVPSNGFYRSQLCARIPLFRCSGQSESRFPMPRTMNTSEASVVFHTTRSSVIVVSIDRQ